MRNIVRVFFIVFCLLIASGCSTTANYEKILGSLVGNTEDSLIAQWGIPDAVYENNGKKYIVYVRQKGVYFPYVAPSYQTRVVGNTAYTTTVGGFPGGSYNYYCKTIFVIENNIVINWKYSGNNCVAGKPSYDAIGYPITR